MIRRTDVGPAVPAGPSPYVAAASATGVPFAGLPLISACTTCSAASVRMLAISTPASGSGAPAALNSHRTARG